MDTQNRQFWLGIGLGVLGLLASVVRFFKNELLLGILVIFILLLMFVLYFVSSASGRGPHYESLKMRKTLTIKDSRGKEAEASCEQRIRARFDNLQGIWRKNNVVDGSMSDFKVDGQPPDKIETFGSNKSFYKQFATPLSKGEEMDVIWTFKATDSLLDAEEAFLHETTVGTKELIMEVVFPDERGFTSASFHEEVGGEIIGSLAGLEKTGQKRLSATVKSPKPGYQGNWHWNFYCLLRLSSCAVLPLFAFARIQRFARYRALDRCANGQVSGIFASYVHLSLNSAYIYRLWVSRAALCLNIIV